jgi:cyclic-di-GMP phosphodiesterase TipF (flagellum assembly factor)
VSTLVQDVLPKETGSPVPAPPARGIDRLIVVCALSIASAIGLASYAHLDFAGWLAALVGAGALAALLAFDRLERRADRIPDLSADLVALQGEVRRLGAAHRAPAMPADSPPRQMALAPSPAPPAERLATTLRRAPLADPHLAAIQPWPELHEAPVPNGRPVTSAGSELRNAPAPAPSRGPTRADTFEHLESLVKELARESGGARAATPDPDRAGAPPPTAYRPATMAEPAARSPDARRLAEAIEAERVDVYLEPIQGLDDRKPRHFEISVRLRDVAGAEIVPPRVLNQFARANGLGARLDAVKLPRIARIADRVRSNGRVSDVLTTLNGESLADNAFIDRLADAFSNEPPSGIVLAFSQADVRAFARLHWDTLAALADLGVRFAIEEVTDLDMDFEALGTCRFAFVKLDAAVFLGGLPAASGLIPAADVCRHFARSGLALVVGRIDDERALARILGFGVGLGQGALFGGPRPVRQDVLGGVAA